MKFSSADLRFRSDDCDRDEYLRLADAVGAFARSKGWTAVFLGFDTRESSPFLSEIILDSLTRHGIDCITPDIPISTCFFYWNCLRNRLPGIMITASHNPSVYNGLKIVDGDLLPVTWDTGYCRIKEYMDGGAPECTCTPGSVTVSDPMEEYVDDVFARSAISPNTKMRILMDFLHGVNAREMGIAMSLLPYTEVTMLHAVPDGRFPAGDPNTLSETSTREFKEELGRGGYDLGFIYDGDGDRTAVYTGDGTRISSISLLIAASSFITDHPKLLSDARTPIPLMKEYGLSLARTGHSHVKHMMADFPERGWTAGAEDSGHFFWSDGKHAVECSLLITLYTMRAWTEKRELLETLMEKESTYIRGGEMNFVLKEPEKKLSALIEHFRAQGAVIIDRDAYGDPLGSEMISMPGYQLTQHVSETEYGTVRWQITEYERHAADDARRYIEMLIQKEE